MEKIEHIFNNIILAESSQPLPQPHILQSCEEQNTPMFSGAAVCFAYNSRSAAFGTLKRPCARQWLYFSYFAWSVFYGRNLCIGGKQSMFHLHPPVEQAGGPTLLPASQTSCILNSQDRSFLRCANVIKLIITSLALFLLMFGNRSFCKMFRITQSLRG